MAFARGPKLNQKYLTNLKRAWDDGGYIVKPDATQIRVTVDDIIALNPSLLIVPTVGKAGKLYSMIPGDDTGDFTVSRNGTATYFGKDGLLKTAAVNEPRLEFDPVSGNFKGVLVESAATNLCIRSDPSSLPYGSNIQFGDNDWGIGLNNKIIFDNQNGTVLCRTGEYNQNSMGRFDTNFAYRVSFFAKRQDEQKPTIMPGTGGVFAYSSLFANSELDVWFDDVLTSSTTFSNLIEKQLNNNVWYFEFKFVATNPGTSRSIGFIKSSANSTNIVEVSGINVTLWEDNKPVSYIPTAGSQVTRPADIITTTTPSNVNQVIYTLDGTEITESITGNTTYTLPTGSITNLYMI